MFFKLLARMSRHAFCFALCSANPWNVFSRKIATVLSLNAIKKELDALLAYVDFSMFSR